MEIKSNERETMDWKSKLISTISADDYYLSEAAGNRILSV